MTHQRLSREKAKVEQVINVLIQCKVTSNGTRFENQQCLSLHTSNSKKANLEKARHLSTYPKRVKDSKRGSNLCYKLKRGNRTDNDETTGWTSIRFLRLNVDNEFQNVNVCDSMAICFGIAMPLQTLVLTKM